MELGILCVDTKSLYLPLLQILVVLSLFYHSKKLKEKGYSVDIIPKVIENEMIHNFEFYDSNLTIFCIRRFFPCGQINRLTIFIEKTASVLNSFS